MDKKFNFEHDAVRKLAEILNDTGLSEIEYDGEHCRIRVVKTPPAMTVMGNNTLPHMMSSAPVIHAPTAPHKESAAPVVSGHIIRSPMVGTAYLSPEPGSPPYVKVGDHVNAGQTLLIIEAMKVMNPIKSPQSGVIKEIHVQNSSPLEFDEPLMIIE